MSPEDVCVCGHVRERHGPSVGCLVKRGLPLGVKERHFCACKQFEQVPLGAEGSLEEAAGW